MLFFTLLAICFSGYYNSGDINVYLFHGQA